MQKNKFFFILALSLVFSFAVLKSIDSNTSLALNNKIGLTSRGYLRTENFRSKIQRPKYNVNCRQIIEMNKTEVDLAKKLLTSLRNEEENIKLLDDENFIFPKEMCSLYKEIRFGNRIIKSNKESQMPLAYSILMYNNVEQFERLLNVLYNPDNVYCIHVDSKANETVKRAVKSITDCFDNVFIATRLEHVVYEGFSRLQADLNCLSDLLELDVLIKSQHANLKNKRAIRGWKYFLNMASSEFPLRTNYELTRILTAYNGSNEIEVLKEFDQSRVEKHYIEDKEQNTVIETDEKKTDAPHYFVIAKGYAYFAISRRFAEYAMWDDHVQDLLEWGKDTFSPDEWFWATLQYNTQKFPTGFKDDDDKTRFNTIVRFAGWEGNYECKGVTRHALCVFSIEDLPEIVNRDQFILNKFLLEDDPIAYQCMEEWFHEREASTQPMNMFFYCDWIKKHSDFANC